VSVRSDPEDPKLLAVFDLIRRTGAKQIQIRYSDDEQPVVWFGVAVYDDTHWETASAHEPLRAMLRLAEQLVDGGMCTHCKRPTGLEPDSLDTMPVNEMICWYQFDPELKTFRRGCEGDTGRYGMGRSPHEADIGSCRAGRAFRARTVRPSGRRQRRSLCRCSTSTWTGRCDGARTSLAVS
jgi:hypothetical protein